MRMSHEQMWFEYRTVCQCMSWGVWSLEWKMLLFFVNAEGAILKLRHYSLSELSGAHWHVLVSSYSWCQEDCTKAVTLHRCTCQVKVIWHQWRICASALITKSVVLLCQLRLNKPCSVACPAMHTILATVLMTNSSICLMHTDTGQKAYRYWKPVQSSRVHLLDMTHTPRI